MKEASWNDCIESKSSIKITPDKQKAESLIETAKQRIKQTFKEINKDNINFAFEDYYSSILELIHALVILESYNVKNHICLGFYLKDVIKREDLFRIFDDCRYKRNSLTYYGRRMDFETAKATITKSKLLIKEIETILQTRK